MIIAVTGATGVVGRFVCDYFSSLNHTVRALHRPTSNRDGFAYPVDWCSGDMTDEEALTKLLAGADAVVHCAFSHVSGRYRGGEGDNAEVFWQTNLGGTLRLLQLSEKLGVSRIVLLSSRAVFARRRAGEDVHSKVSDDHPLWPDTHYGALKAAEEALAGAYSQLCVCALRPTGVYGLSHPLAASKWYTLVEQVLRGDSGIAPRSSTEVHGRDVAKAIECLLTAPAEVVRGRGFNCSDIQITTRHLVQQISQRLACAAKLPDEGAPVVNPMACAALEALGWSPGGQALLTQTLDELVAAVLQANPPS